MLSQLCNNCPHSALTYGKINYLIMQELLQFILNNLIINQLLIS